MIKWRNDAVAEPCVDFLDDGLATASMNSPYRMLFDAAPHAYLVLRAEPPFEILFVNELYLNTTGARRESLLGRSFVDVLRDDPDALAPVGDEEFRASLARAIDGGAPDESFVSQLANGDDRAGAPIRRWRRINRPVADESGKPAYVLCHIEEAAPPLRRESEAAADESQSADDIAAERPLIVIADADPATRNQLATELAAAGFDAFHAADGESALAACLKAPAALLVSDAPLLGLDGIALTRRLRADENAAALPIVVLSERCGEDARVEGFGAGADEFLEKPVAARELVARIAAIVKRSRARAGLAAKRLRVAVLARLASVVETAMDAVISIDASQNITLFSAAAEKVFGCSAQEALGRPIGDFIPERFRASHVGHVEAFGRTGVSGRTMGRLGELTALRADGVEFPIEASISQARVDGELLFTVILRDISERKAAAETQRLLIGELDHRVKNTLAMVQAIARQTAKASADPKLFLESFDGRVQAMSIAHSLLTRAGWRGADLGDLIREQLTLGPPDADPRITSSGPKIFLEPQFALHFGMVLHELGANARKFGALSTPAGRVDLAWRIEERPDGSWLMFDWIESGGPPTAPPIKKNFGTRLIESSLTHSLHGNVALDFAPTGLRCKISLPLRPHEV